MSNHDFTKFYFGDKSSSDFGLLVVSNGSRYTSNLTSNFEVRTTSIPGRPTPLFWGADKSGYTIAIELATDGMTEIQLNDFIKHFTVGRVEKLSFEETSYKYIWATISMPPTFDFIPFDRENGLLYKGELHMEFTTLSSEYYSNESYVSAAIPGSGLPMLSQFPNNATIHHIAKKVRIANRAVTATKGSGNNILVYHAGNGEANAEITFSWATAYGIGPHVTPGPAAIGPSVTWGNFQIDNGLLTMPRFFKDINLVLQLVYQNYDTGANWANAKVNVLNILREELDGAAKDTLLLCVGATGTGLTFTSASALRTYLISLFFTGATYTFSINGIGKQVKLTTTGTKRLNSSLVEESYGYVEDNTGSFNGRYPVIKPSGVLVPLGTQTIVSNNSLTNVEVNFQNTYI